MVLLTGASRGIGAAAARHLAHKHVRLALAATSLSNLRGATSSWPLRQGEDLLLLEGDLADPQTAIGWVAQTRRHFGRLDTLVNNAGVIGPIGPLESAGRDEFANNVAVNLLAPVWACQAALPALRASGGRIINVSSGAGVRPVSGWGAYCTAKAGLNQLTRQLALEVPEVTAVAFSPGMTDTDMQAEIRRDGPEGMPEATLSTFVQAHTSGQLRSVEAVGKALAALSLYVEPSSSGAFVAVDEPAVEAAIQRLEAD